MVIGDDQAVGGNERSRATIHTADAIHQADCLSIEDLIGSQFHAALLEVQFPKFADGEHSFIGNAAGTNCYECSDHRGNHDESGQERSHS